MPNHHCRGECSQATESTTSSFRSVKRIFNILYYFNICSCTIKSAGMAYLCSMSEVLNVHQLKSQ